MRASLARPRRWIAVVGLASLALASACTNAPPPVTGGDAPAGDAFYVPPTPLRGSAPGDLQWHRTIAASGFPGADVHLVLYRSIDAHGQPMAVSGAVLVPKAAYRGAGARPIVGFAPATTGFTDDCAPTRGIAGGGGGFLEGANVQQALGKGWAVALTDYQGLGTPGQHTYMVKDAQAHAVLDAVRAGTRLPGAGLSVDAPVVLWGYSQGGAAAGAAAEEAPAYAPELSIKAAALGGVPGDLIAVNNHLNGTYYGLALTAGFGYDAVYPELQIDQVLNAAGRAEAARHFSENATGSCVSFLINNYVGKRPANYFTVDPMTLPAWKARFTEAELGLVTPTMPIYQYHAASDQIIPHKVGEEVRDRWCARGATVQFNGSVVGDHLLGAVSGAGSAVTYLADRLAGKRALSTC
jgi:hypothetical protein